MKFNAIDQLIQSKCFGIVHFSDDTSFDKLGFEYLDIIELMSSVETMCNIIFLDSDFDEITDVKSLKHLVMIKVLKN